MDGRNFDIMSSADIVKKSENMLAQVSEHGEQRPKETRQLQAVKTNYIVPRMRKRDMPE